MENQIDRDLTKGAVWKILISFTIPIFLGTLFQSLYTTADAIIVGRYAGKEALAAIESVFTMLKIPINFFVGLATAASILVSQHYGAKENEKVSKSSHNAILFSIIVGIGLSLILAILSPRIIKLINVPKEIIPSALKYVRIYFLGMIALMVYNMGAGILRALGDSKTPFSYLMVANVTNIVLDLVFIIVFKLGVVGAAVATIISQFIAAVLIIIKLMRNKIISIKKLKIHKEHLEEILKTGLPIAVQSTLFPVSNVIVQSHINIYGVDYIAGWGVSGKLDFLVWYISEAFGSSVSIFTAQNYGAKKFDRIEKGVKTAVFCAFSLVAVVSLILYIFRFQLSAILVKDHIVVEKAAEMITLFAPFYSLYALCDIFPSAIKGTGETFRPMVVTLICTCLSRIIWVTAMPESYRSFKMVLWCYPMSWILTSGVFFIYYMFFKKEWGEEFA